jgi:hypothetical protein
MMETISIPARIAALPVDKIGRPVPWFVEWIHGVPDFRVAGAAKIADAVRFSRCWVCGQHLGRYMTFTVGPMCAVNRTSSEPPAHQECAEFSVQRCPFLITPAMVRRDRHLPAGAGAPAGIMLARNPGVALLWVTRTFGLRRTPTGPLFVFGDPVSVQWWAQGRRATRAEVVASIDSGLPALQALTESDAERTMLDGQVSKAMALAPAA